MHVFQRDHSFRAAVFVQHDRQLVVLLLKQFQQAIQRHRFGHQQRRVEQFPQLDRPAQVQLARTDP